MPKTKLGRLSLWLIIAFAASMLVFSFSAVVCGVLGISGGDKPTDNLFLFIPMILAAVAGNLSFITGLISIIFLKERSHVMVIPMLIGFFVFFFTLGETISIH